ncbi:MAG: hypothetical protein JW776_03110 [Candidatus Lokiarchaeota archaeon]|nr:hypothetical protein [Candidatus Lokiarchaeota archaeon]
MIDGIRRRETAEESADVFFQTTKRIISHFRREEGKNKIYELCGKENTLTNLLIASSVVQAFDYWGIHTKDPLDTNVSSLKLDLIEKTEKKEIYNEFSSLVKDTIDYEIKLLEYENSLLKKCVNTIITLQGEIHDKEREEISKALENQLNQILFKFPIVYFYDYTGDLLGISKEVRRKIIKESSAFKPIGRAIEEELIEEENIDQYLELSVLNGVQSEMRTKFEFENVRELKIETIPMHLILNQILRNLLEVFPTSTLGLEAFQHAIKFREELTANFSQTNKRKRDYESFEKNILDLIQDELSKISIEKTANYIIYFLECLLEYNFNEITSLFNRLGVMDIPEFVNLFSVDKKRVNQILKTYGINKMDLIKIGNPVNNPLSNAESELVKIKQSNPQLQNITLQDLLDTGDHEYNNVISDIASRIGMSTIDLRKFYHKKLRIEQRILNETPITNLSSMILFYDHDDILSNLCREVYFQMLAKITRQISRILETYNKVKEDQSRYLTALKKLHEHSEDQQWVVVKIEELIIQRITNRQKELTTIFDADRDPFLVNGFILARFLDTKLSDATKMLETQPSSIYSGIKELRLPSDMISPISYSLAYDLLERYKMLHEKRKLQVEEAKRSEFLKRKQIKDKIREDQNLHTLDWIERRVTSSMMRITSKGITPTTLYWNEEKDGKTCSENMKKHSELGTKSTMELFTDYFYFAVSCIKKQWPEFILDSRDSIKDEVYAIISQELSKRIGKIPTEEEIDSEIIEGERWTIANQLSDRIGKQLDKVLYQKFKKHL